jgi:nucleotide-binding universal stress UspA family protein
MQQREKCLEYLDEVRQRLTYPDVDTLVRPGTPDEEILLSAEELNASVVVAATHGRSGLSRWVYGSTAGHLLHESSVPLLIIGREALERNEASPAFTHLMVPLDGSRLSEQALTPAIDVARRTSARVSLVRAVPWAAQTYPFFTPGPYVPQLDQELVARATDYLAQRRSEIPAGVNAETELLRGPAAECLLAYEEGNAVDLVVMTTHARAGLRRALLGSTADRVLHGRAPVLLIRPAETAVKPAESVATTEAAGA